MRVRLSGLLALSAALLAQAPDETRTLAFAHLETPRQIQEFVNSVRAIADVNRSAADFEARVFTLTASHEQVELARWLLAELDKAPGVRPPAFESHDATFADPRSPAVKVCFLVHTANPQQLQEAVNAVRSLAEVQRVMVVNASGAIVLRGNQEQIAFAEWLLREMDADGAGAAPRQTREYTYPDTLTSTPSRRRTAVRFYRPAEIKSPIDLQEAINSLRSIAEVQRLVAFTAGPSISLRGADPQAVVTDWLMSELDRRDPAPGNHELRSPALNGDIIRLFFPSNAKTPQELQTDINLVRQSVGVQRAVMYPRLRAIVVRGTPEQIAASAALLP